MDFALHIIISVGHWLPTVLGYNLIFGKGKIFHFGPLGTSLLTSYTIYLTVMATGSFSLGILCGVVMICLISVLYAWLSLRLEPDGLAVMSLAVHLAMIAIVLNWNSITRGALGVPGIPRMPGLDNNMVFAAVLVTVCGCYIWFYHWLDRNAFGRQLAALAEHEWHAKAMGINRVKVHTLAFLCLGFGQLAGNLFFPQYIRFMHPNDFHFTALIFLVMTVVAGGPGSVRGVVIATILITLLKEGLRFVPLAPDILGPTRLMLFGLILFAAVWWRRDSLFPQQRTV